MDETNGRRETHDFMNVNVESFSQLPFNRRTPSKEKSPIIRLFGQELVGDNSENVSANSSYQPTTKNNESSDRDKDNNNKNNNKRFECHYCFRNFPTSQALGGHQNAHKRERQHAKRGSMTSYLHHNHQSDVYGFLNNHHQRHYPSWSTDARYYGGGGGHQTSSYYSRSTLPPLPSNPPTINGSPVGLWRVPPSTSANAFQGVYSTSPASGFRTHEQETKEPNYPYRLMKPNVHDHVSLDLHL